MKVKIPITIEPGHKKDTGSRIRDVHIPFPLSSDEKDPLPKFRISGTEWHMLAIVIEEEKSSENKNNFIEKAIERTEFNIRYVGPDERFPGTIYLEIDTSKKTIEATVPEVLEKNCWEHKITGYSNITLTFEEKTKVPLKIIEEDGRVIEGRYIVFGNFKMQKIIKRIYKNKTTIKEDESNNGEFLKLLIGPKSILSEIPVADDNNNKGRMLVGNIESHPEITLRTRVGTYTLTVNEKCKDSSTSAVVFVGADREKDKLIVKHKDKEFKISSKLIYFKVPIEGMLLVFGEGESIISRVRKNYGE